MMTKMEQICALNVKKDIFLMIQIHNVCIVVSSCKTVTHVLTKITALNVTMDISMIPLKMRQILVL